MVGGFVGDEEDFELYLIWDREPDEILEEQGGMVLSVDEETGSILDVLRFI